MKIRAVILLMETMLLITVSAPVLATVPCVDAGSRLNLKPSSLVIGSFYAGQSVKISGEIGAGQEVLLEVQGPRRTPALISRARSGLFG